MALNITFTGNVVNELEEAIDCNYKVFYISGTTLFGESPVLQTEFMQYNFNAGSSTHLSQEGELKQNNYIIVAFFTAPTIEEAQNEKLSAIVFTHDGITTTYIQDAQLLDISNMPICDTWSIDGNTTNNPTIINTNDILDYTWMYAGTRHYHRRMLYNNIIFPNLQIETKEYNFTGVFQLLNTYTYTDIGDKIIQYKVQIGPHIYICDKIHRIYFNAPIPNIIFPLNVTLGQNINVINEVIDTDNTIISIDYTYIGTHISTEVPTVDPDTHKYTYKYTQEIITLDGIQACQNILWNNGFEEQILNYCESLVVENQPPLINWFIPKETTKNIFEMQFEYDQIDDEVKIFKYYIYYKLPFSQSYTLDIVDSLLTDDFPTYEFLESGEYKIVLELEDLAGNKSSKEYVLDIACNSSSNAVSCETDRVREIRVKRVDNIEFTNTHNTIDINSNKTIDLETQTTQISEIETINIDLIKTVDIFVEKEKNITISPNKNEITIDTKIINKTINTEYVSSNEFEVMKVEQDI